MNTRSRLRAGFDLARAGNFFSVASNVLAALVLSASANVEADASAGSGPFSLGWSVLVLAIVGGCLIYAGGATFNDVFDASFDARRRPERAIPRGIFSRRDAAVLASVEMLAGVSILILLGAAAAWMAALVAVILVYDWIHKRWIGSVMLMAGCRVILGCALASLPGHEFSPAFLGWICILFVYIVTLSLLARWECAPGAPAAKLGPVIGRLLAFIPLIDASALLLAGAWAPAMACALAVPLGRWAQRLAAST
ncbi:MAG: UbiA family prenyltransferase [Opitutaceae bacterium]